MALRKVQDVLAADPNYGGTFDADGPASPNKAPAFVSAEPQPQGRRSPRTSKTPETPSTTSEVAESEALKAVQAEPVEPARSLASRVKRTEATKGRTRTPVSLRLRPLTTQTERIDATGMDPREIMKAAWRLAVASCTVEPTFTKPPVAERAAGRTYLFESTVMVDAEVLAGLAREHDRLGVKGPWWLIRGQHEPAFWTALDAILEQLAAPDRPSRASS